jgi:sulfite reductase alpha subunit-like flavoprotein
VVLSPKIRARVAPSSILADIFYIPNTMKAHETGTNDSASDELSSLFKSNINITKQAPDERYDDPERKALILYGSESGNAQDSAERIGLEMLRYHFRVRIVSMDAYSLVSHETVVREYDG